MGLAATEGSRYQLSEQARLGERPGQVSGQATGRLDLIGAAMADISMDVVDEDGVMDVGTPYASVYPALQNLLLAARSVGLGASLITLPLWSSTSARKILGLPISVMPACVVPLGWPQGRYGPTTRRPVGDVTHLDRFGNQPWKGAGST